MNFYASQKFVDDIDFDDRASFVEKESIYGANEFESGEGTFRFCFCRRLQLRVYEVVCVRVRSTYEEMSFCRLGLFHSSFTLSRQNTLTIKNNHI